jgi:tetratricopeptide (TPR) repeat protein
MWFYLPFFAVIAVSLFTLGGIVARKFPQLTLIDAESLPKERDAKRKREIIRRRVDRLAGAWGRKFAADVLKSLETARERFREQYRKVLALERKYRKELRLTPAAVREKVPGLLVEAAALVNEGKAAEAEKKYIEVVSLDSRSADAYRGLARLFLDDKRYEQARETFAYLIRMAVKENRCLHGKGRHSFSGAVPNPGSCPASSLTHADIAKHCVDLAYACQSLGDVPGTVEAYERAVAMEPSNPRHLDLLLDACILGGDKVRASEVFGRLAEVNPENNKLSLLQEKIASLPDAPDQKKARKSVLRILPR